MKIFLPSHHACNRTPRTSKLVPSNRASRGGRGDKVAKVADSVLAVEGHVTSSQVEQMKQIYSNLKNIIKDS